MIGRVYYHWFEIRHEAWTGLTNQAHSFRRRNNVQCNLKFASVTICAPLALQSLRRQNAIIRYLVNGGVISAILAPAPRLDRQLRCCLSPARDAMTLSPRRHWQRRDREGVYGDDDVPILPFYDSGSTSSCASDHAYAVLLKSCKNTYVSLSATRDLNFGTTRWRRPLIRCTSQHCGTLLDRRHCSAGSHADGF